MAGERVLEVEQAEVRDAFASLDQHDVLGMVIAQHGHRSEAVGGDRGEHLAPCGAIAFGVDVEVERGAIPVGEQRQLGEPLVEPVDGQAGHRRMLVKVDEDVGGDGVKLGLAVAVLVEPLAQAVVAEVAEQQQPVIEVAGEDFGRGEPDLAKPFGDRDVRARILVRRRRVHQHRAAPVVVEDAEIAAETGVPGERFDARPAPPAGGEEIGRGGGGNHCGGHRPSQPWPGCAVKTRAPSPATPSDRASAVGGHASAPACPGHSTTSTPSPSTLSRPSSASSEGCEMR